jgi:RNA polymerase sigma-70 factor (ECF subfamily)
MDRLERRSTGVTEMLATPAQGSPADVEFERLYRASRDDVYAYVATLMRDRFAAEDVTALAFERAYRKRSSFRPGRGSPRAWLFGIARNAALDELRRRTRSAALDAEPLDDAAPSLEDEAERGARRLALRSALQSLPPRERELVALKIFAGLSNAELATVLGTSETNAGTRLHRAVLKLREACHETA